MSFIPDKEEVDEAEANGDVKLMRVFFETAAKERLCLLHQVGELVQGRSRTVVTVQGHEASPDTPSACMLMASFRLRELAASYGKGAWREDRDEWQRMHDAADYIVLYATWAVGYLGKSAAPPIMPYSNVWG